LEHLLFAGYLVLFSWIITKIKFFSASGLTKPQLMLLFLIKVMAGIFYGWIGVYYGQLAQMIDTWAYHAESLQEYELLKSHPGEFIYNLFHTTYEGGYSNFLTTEQSWWNDVKSNFIIKLMAIFNLFSFGHYYVNVIFICFLTFFGPVAIYRVMKQVFPNKNLPVLLASFFIPSFLYWTSGLHKEGLIFCGLALMIYHFYFGFSEKRFGIKRWLGILLGFLLVLILRNFLIFTLLPPLIAWMLTERFKWKPVPVFGITALLFVVLFFTARYLHPAADLPRATVIKQEEFLKLGGGSAVAVTRLEPSFKSFVSNAPQAAALSMVRPYPSDVRHLLSLAAAVEINLLLLMLVLFLFSRPFRRTVSPFACFCILFSFGVLMMIGYTVNILGAVVRYRSIVLPLLVVPMAAIINWKGLTSLIGDNITTKDNVS